MKSKLKATLTSVFLIFSLAHAQTDSELISYSFEGEALVNVIEKLEEVTKYSFSYSSTSIPTDFEVTATLTQATISEALNIVFANTLITYEIMGERIILKLNQTLQTVRGTVVDRYTGIPIPGVTVVILNTSPLKGNATDSEGKFRIRNVVAGRYSIKASFLGFEDVIIPDVLVGSGKEVVLNIEIAESLLQLEEIQVGVNSGTSSAPINHMAQVSGRSFTVEETKRFPISVGDPLRLASSFAGVIATDDGDNEIVIRGNSPRGILWKMEGVEIPNPNHFSSEGASSGGISMFSTQVISRSDFFTSAFPAEYGNATAGVFDIKLRSGNNERRESTLQFGLLGLDVSSEGPLSRRKKASYLLNYRYSTLSILTGLGLELEGEGERNIFQDLSFKVNMPTEKAGVFSVFGMGGLSSYVFKLPNVDITDTEKYNMGVLGVSNKYILNNRTVLSSTVSVSGTEIVNNENVPIDAGRYIEETTFQKTFIRTSLELDNKFSAKHLLNTGFTFSSLDYDFKSSESDPRNDSLFQFIEWFNDEGNTTSLQGYTSWKYRPTSKLSFVNGLHMTLFNLTNEMVIEPRTSVRWEYKPTSALFAGFGLHSRIESLEYYFGNAPNRDGSTTDLNLDLGLTRSSHFVAGFETSVNERVHFKAEVYYQHLFNVPILAGEADNSLTAGANDFSTINLSEGYVYNNLVNGGTGDNYGIELTLERKFAQNYYFLLNGTLYESTYEGRDGVTRSTRYNGNFGYNIVAGKEYRVGSVSKDKTLGVNLKINHAGNKRKTPIYEPLTLQNGRATSLLSEVYTEKYPYYFRADLQLSLRNNKRGRTSEWRLDIQNLTNRENVVLEYFDFNSRSVIEEGQFGLIPILSYRVEF